MIEYPQIKSLPEAYVRAKLNDFFLEDCPDGDVTTMGTVNPEVNKAAYLQAEGEFVFAGYYILAYAFSDKVDVNIKVQDGDLLQDGQIFCDIEGPAHEILQKERVILNLLQRLSGIATNAARYVKKAEPFGVKILDTRKTTPGLRLMEKYAVTCGGAYNHRLDLSSGILIKDNHIEAAGSIAAAVNMMKEHKGDLPVQVEVENYEQLYEALEAGVSGVLIDNFPPYKTRRAVEIIRNRPGGEFIFVESSGGINLNTIEEYSTTGINAASVGALTHTVRSADIHLEFRK